MSKASKKRSSRLRTLKQQKPADEDYFASTTIPVGSIDFVSLDAGIPGIMPSYLQKTKPLHDKSDPRQQTSDPFLTRTTQREAVPESRTRSNRDNSSTELNTQLSLNLSDQVAPSAIQSPSSFLEETNSAANLENHLNTGLQDHLNSGLKDQKGSAFENYPDPAPEDLPVANPEDLPDYALKDPESEQLTEPVSGKPELVTVKNQPKQAANETQTRSSGFRLKSVQVYNWGTFNGQVWKLDLGGKNSLLTGNNGSGKSTFVDAITTLLYPSNKVAYNKAAGAEGKERSLRSYVMGFYKSERSETETGRGSKPVALRDHNDFSVILGVFHNADYNQTVSLAQVFWLKDAGATPARFYVAAEKELSISGDFDKFGTEIAKLKKRLRAECDIFETFPEYGAWYRRRFGIASEQAMELFHQTISMKSVGNLTDFVRQHMLEPFAVESRIEALINHFDDLNSLHENVLKAEQQIKRLTPLVEDSDALAKVKLNSEELRACREALKTYFAEIKFGLLSRRLESLSEEWTRANNQVVKSEERLLLQKSEESKLNRNIAENGGDRIEQLTHQIKQKELEREKRKSKADRYQELVQVLGWRAPGEPEAFQSQLKDFAAVREQHETGKAAIQNKLTELSLQFRQGKNEHTVISEEIDSLRKRKSNIPRAQVGIRAEICSALQFAEDDLPFAGELLKIHDNELDWEGAAERVMRNFGLSLLVPDKYYEAVANWVDSTHLRDRLVYFRVRTNNKRLDSTALHPDSLARKVAIKPDSEFYEWLDREVGHRFNHVCCHSLEDFRRQTFAITRSGQLKSGGEKHEKDDRHHIGDRSRYVLGWTNAAKIEALQIRLKVLEIELGKIADDIAKNEKAKSELDDKLKALSKLEEYKDFNEIDWQGLVLEIDALRKEKEDLESASDLLIKLTESLKALQQEIKETEKTLVEQRDRRSRTAQKQSDAEESYKETESFLSDPGNEQHKQHFASLDSMKSEALGDHSPSVESCFNREQEMREWLQRKLDNEIAKMRTLEQRIVKVMQQYNDDFPLDTQEVNAHVDSAAEYAKMLQELQMNALPRFKEKFKQMLNENAINEIAHFQSQLNRERELIKDRISHINKSLTEIQFTADSYIVLEATSASDADIRDFQTELRTCTEGALTGSDAEEYSEAKFLEVKRIIERFRGREGTAESDKRWTERVTDVRNWFTFAASERWIEDNEEKEHYSDSSGKSGGQKEKLAYTILAASLAYQFGLGLNAPRSRTFRFVVIDEAFGRGSDDSAKYGLSLFGKLGLQLLVVTPMQKIHVISPFVNSVGFVSNEGGNNSKLRNLSIEEYLCEQAARTIKKEPDLV